MEKLEWCDYPRVRNFKDIFIRFGATHERNGQTPGDGIYRAYAYASRGKNHGFRPISCFVSKMMQHRFQGHNII